MTKRFAGLLGLTLALGGCWGGMTSVTTPVTAVNSAGTQVISASNMAGGGSVTIDIVALDGSEQAVQATPRGRKTGEIKGYSIAIFPEGSSTPRFTTNYSGTKTKFKIENISVVNEGGDSLFVRIQAFSDTSFATTANITDGGKADSGNFTLIDQQATTANVTLKLKGGATANGDVTATVGVSNGDETAPNTTVEAID